MLQDPNATIMALDVGGRRIGVAVAGSVARIARPLTTLVVGETIMEDIARLVASEQATELCIGLPRGLDGQETQQTTTVRQFVGRLKQVVQIPVYLQDEAVTSQQAKAALQARDKPYAKGDVDALAAAYILEDFLHDHHQNHPAETMT